MLSILSGILIFRIFWRLFLITIVLKDIDLRNKVNVIILQRLVLAKRFYMTVLGQEYSKNFSTSYLFLFRMIFGLIHTDTGEIQIISISFI